MKPLFIDIIQYKDLGEEEVLFLQHFNELNFKDWMYEEDRRFYKQRMFYFLKNSGDNTRITFSFDKKGNIEDIFYFYVDNSERKELSLASEDDIRKEICSMIWTYFQARFGVRLKLLFSEKEQI